MNTKQLLQLIGLAVLVVLLGQVIWQFHRVRKGGQPLGKQQAFLNLFLLALLVVCFGMASMAKSQAVSKKSTATPPAAFCSQVTVKNRQVEFTFTIPQGGKLALYQGTNLLASVDNSQGKKATSFSYTFQKAGSYRLKTTKAGHSSEKLLRVAPSTVQAKQPAKPATAKQPAKQAPKPQPKPVQPPHAPQQNTPVQNNAPAGYHYEYRTVRVPINR